MALQEEETDVQVTIMDDESEHNPSNVELGGILALHPKQEKKDIVVFAHTSGSGRQSPRNQYVASILNNADIDTLLADLLISEEQKVDEKLTNIDST